MPSTTILDNLADATFLLATFCFFLMERYSSLKRTLAPIRLRWLTNIGLMLASMMLSSILFTHSISEIAAELPNGFIRRLSLPVWLEAALLLALLDCFYYWVHRVFHEVPLLWRIHLVHHSDTAVDISTSVRHHPLEKILVTLLLCLLVFALGFSAQAFGLYVLVTTASAIMTHANITLPTSLERGLRPWLVTPAVHAVHHSSHAQETNCNYGSVFSVWDRLFGTYSAPTHGPTRFGLEYFRREQDGTLLATLIQPLQYRQNTPRTQGQATSPHQQTHRLSPAWRQALLYSGLGLGLSLLAFWPTVLDLTRLWTDVEAYQYAWFVGPMFVYIVGWYRRDSILAMTPQTGYFGLPLMLAAALIWLMCYSAEIMLGQHLALVIMLQGIALCALGKTLYLKLLPIMLLLFLMIPSGDLFQLPLRHLTTHYLSGFAILADLPHSLDGYRLTIGEQHYVVLPACSGLSLFLLGGFLGYSIGLLLFRSVHKVLALAAVGAAFGMLANAIRVCSIVSIDWVNGTQMNLAEHKDIQWLLVALMIGSLLYLSGRLKLEAWPHTRPEP